jgi:hypothetical protein
VVWQLRSAVARGKAEALGGRGMERSESQLANVDSELAEDGSMLYFSCQIGDRRRRDDGDDDDLLWCN